MALLASPAIALLGQRLAQRANSLLQHEFARLLPDTKGQPAAVDQLEIAARAQALGRRKRLLLMPGFQLQANQVDVDLVLVLYIAGLEALFVQAVANALDQRNRRFQRGNGARPVTGVSERQSFAIKHLPFQFRIWRLGQYRQRLIEVHQGDNGHTLQPEQLRLLIQCLADQAGRARLVRDFQGFSGAFSSLGEALLVAMHRGQAQQPFAPGDHLAGLFRALHSRPVEFRRCFELALPVL